MKNQNNISRKNFGLGFVVISFVFIFYFIFKFNPELKYFINATVRYIFVFCTIGTLLILSLQTMHRMYREKEIYNLIRSCFGVVSAVLISLIIENSINQSIINFIKTTYNPIAYYSGAVFVGIFTCSIGARLINHNKPIHTKPFLVFVCCTIASLIFQVTTVPYIKIDITLLLTYFLGITFYPLIFHSFGGRKKSPSPAKTTKPTKNIVSKEEELLEELLDEN